MEFGIQLSNMQAARFAQVAQAAEELGFDSVLFPDHLVSEGPERQLNPRDLVYDHFTIAAVVAAATKKVRIGHLVACNLFRHPMITAQAMMTLDHLSNGRLLAGMGTGWTQTEFEMSGIAFPPIAERLRMLDEALTCMRSLWSEERTTFAGEFYHLRDAIMWPKPLQKPHPPIIVGGGGRGLLRIAAKHADYVNIIADAGKPGKVSLESVKRFTADSFRAKCEFVREEAKRNGRVPRAIRMSSFFFITMLTESREATRKFAEGMAPMFGVSPEQVLQSPMTLIGTPEECVGELKRRAADWGVSQCIFTGPIASNETELRRFHEQVLAHV